MELLQRKAGIKLSHMPYKTAPQPVLAVVGGEVGAMSAAIGRALASPEAASKLKELDVTPSPAAPGELDRTVRADMAVNRDLVKSLGLKLD